LNGALITSTEECMRMILRQFLHHDPVGISYLFGCGGKASGAAVDPIGDLDPYLPSLRAEDNDTLALGNVVATVLHTPGHTPEHICLLVTDRTRADEPWCVLTGHTMMVGDLGRTELASNAEQGARDLFRSIERLKALPDYVEVLPGAYSGSVCGRGLSGKPSSTIGFERRHNKAFRITDESEFIRFMTAEIPPAPPEAARLRAMNAGSAAIAA
jgi:glyoxylase-like metal-dependent hydrolase (beta-lactamase superfamily II)